MDIKEHKKAFDRIIKKYDLSNVMKAEEIAEFLTTHKNESVSAEEFAKLFAMSPKEAMVFLSFIQKGIQFKKEHKL